MNPDIMEERENVAFDVEEFTNWYHGGKENVEEKRFLGKLIYQLKSLIELKFFEL